MSKMQELYEKVSKDEVLYGKFSKIMKEAEKAGKEVTEAKLTTFAKEVGYDVTLEEMQTFFKQLDETNQDGLSDAELDMVAGGKTQGEAVVSLMTLGTGCLFASILGTLSRITCSQEINEDLDRQIF